jgi:hypothetical protein
VLIPAATLEDFPVRSYPILTLAACWPPGRCCGIPGCWSPTGPAAGVVPGRRPSRPSPSLVPPMGESSAVPDAVPVGSCPSGYAVRNAETMPTLPLDLRGTRDRQAMLAAGSSSAPRSTAGADGRRANLDRRRRFLRCRFRRAAGPSDDAAIAIHQQPGRNPPAEPDGGCGGANSSPVRSTRRSRPNRCTMSLTALAEERDHYFALRSAPGRPDAVHRIDGGTATGRLDTTQRRLYREALVRWSRSPGRDERVGRSVGDEQAAFALGGQPRGRRIGRRDGGSKNRLGRRRATGRHGRRHADLGPNARRVRPRPRRYDRGHRGTAAGLRSHRRRDAVGHDRDDRVDGLRRDDPDRLCRRHRPRR